VSAVPNRKRDPLLLNPPLTVTLFPVPLAVSKLVDLFVRLPFTVSPEADCISRRLPTAKVMVPPLGVIEVVFPFCRKSCPARLLIPCVRFKVAPGLRVTLPESLSAPFTDSVVPLLFKNSEPPEATVRVPPPGVSAVV